MEKPVFFTAIIKKNLNKLRSGQTIFFKKTNGKILVVCEKFIKELSVKDFLDKAVPIIDNKSERLYYNPRAAKKAEKLMMRR
mgnify:CR=1 FL=1